MGVSLYKLYLILAWLHLAQNTILELQCEFLFWELQILSDFAGWNKWNFSSISIAKTIFESIRESYKKLPLNL